MKANRYNFTKKFIEDLKPAEQGKRLYYKDNKVNGLELMVTDKGTKSFKVTRKKDGRVIRVTIGHYPDISIENARKKAFEINSQIADGINPNIEKNQLKQDITFGNLFNEFIERYAKQHKITWRQDQRDTNRLCKKWFKRKISTITNQEIRLFHEKLGKETPYMANRMLAKIKVIYNKAIEWGYKGDNPANNIKQFKEQSRERFILPEEVGKFFKSLDQEENHIIRDYIYISIYTGARKSNILAMKWDQIEFNIKQWQIPKTKNGDSQTLPLINDVIQILKNRKIENDKLDLPDLQKQYVLPSLTSASGHLTEPKKGWKRILQRAEITNLRLHDVRRTLGSYMTMQGFSEAIIGKTLGHKTSEATKVYSRMNIDPVKKGIEGAVELMNEYRDDG